VRSERGINNDDDDDDDDDISCVCKTEVTVLWIQSEHLYQTGSGTQPVFFSLGTGRKVGVVTAQSV
jgi:hypothetical protein